MPSPARPRSESLAAACALMLAALPLHAADDDGALEPIVLQADRIRSVTDGETDAEGDVELRRGTVLIRADRLRYRPADDRAMAEGGVRVERDGLLFRGPSAEMTVGDLEGWFLQPEFEFLRHGTRGSATRVEFQGRARLRAEGARYTSCPRDGSGDPDWVLEAREVALDFDANEGRAKGAVLRFLGTPILALPALSFPVTDARKSGWLPPSVGIDSRSGVEFSMPWYWNIAPNFDATIAPRLSARRGLAAEGEFRYLLPQLDGRAALNLLPHDRQVGRSRYALDLRHDHALPLGIKAHLGVSRVSDDDWWKDFSGSTTSLTPRLLPLTARAERDFDWTGGQVQAYLRVQDWQVLQDSAAPIVSPYSRRPQVGLRASTQLAGFELSLRTELNRFDLADRDLADPRTDGWRWHASGAVAWPWRGSAGWVTPRVAVHATRYRADDAVIDGLRHASRVVPSFSIDAGLAFDRDTSAFFDRTVRQTLEPRLLYVYTPYRRQDQLPNFDAFGKEFNFSSVFADNPFSGQDRIADAHQITAGVTSRLVDPDNGAELLRMGIAQRYLFRDQRVAPRPDGSVDGATLPKGISDVLLLGSATPLKGVSFDASLQFNPDNARLMRSIVGASWTPAPFQTVNLRYRLARDLSEQVEVGWQWPVYRGPTRTGSSCSGSLFTVGRVNYSVPERRVTDSVLGFEYDAGCWIGRIVAERLSTGRTEAATRLLLQLELVGLSRLGSNPLRILKDNIPGYRLLRDERGDSPLSRSP